MLEKCFIMVLNAVGVIAVFMLLGFFILKLSILLIVKCVIFGFWRLFFCFIKKAAVFVIVYCDVGGFCVLSFKGYLNCFFVE